MKNHRIFAKTWFRVGGVALVLGAALLAMLLFDLPASAYPPEPTPTPQQDVELHAESQHSARAVFDSTSPSLTGSYYEWGWAKTCRDVDFDTSPPTCIGETSTFYCSDEEIHNLAVLYDVTEGGYAKIEMYRPDGTQYGSGCQWEIEDPGYGHYWGWYALDCYDQIACSPMTYSWNV